MIFKVAFQIKAQGEKYHKLASAPAVPLGLRGVDAMRGLTDPKLEMDRIAGETWSRSWNTWTVEISEELARRSGRFNDRNVCAVFVEPYGLDGAIVWEVNWYGVDKEARFLPFIDAERVLAEWERAGFPKEWQGIEGEVKYPWD